MQQPKTVIMMKVAALIYSACIGRPSIHAMGLEQIYVQVHLALQLVTLIHDSGGNTTWCTRPDSPICNIVKIPDGMDMQLACGQHCNTENICFQDTPTIISCSDSECNNAAEYWSANANLLHVLFMQTDLAVGHSRLATCLRLTLCWMKLMHLLLDESW